MKKFKILFILFLVLVLKLVIAPVALAMCPVCTVAIAGGLGLSRWLKVDDTVSGIWIGAFLLSSSLWFYSWITKKYPKLHTTFYLLLTTASMYFLVLGPLSWTDILGHPLNKIWGIDKLIVGSLAGSIAFLGGIWLDKKARLIKGKQFFNYQKIVFPLIVLVISSVIFWLMTKNG